MFFRCGLFNIGIRDGDDILQQVSLNKSSGLIDDVGEE
jgi:hypothetical protein